VKIPDMTMRIEIEERAHLVLAGLAAEDAKEWATGASLIMGIAAPATTVPGVLLGGTFGVMLCVVGALLSGVGLGVGLVWWRLRR
jgi:hypothetical protein